MESEPQPEGSSQPFVRVEVDKEYKNFTKQCEADGCTVEFTTSVPKEFFINPEDESTQLRVNGQEKIHGTDILAADVERRIFDRQPEHKHSSTEANVDA